MLRDGVYRCSVCLNLFSMDLINKLPYRFYPGIIHEDELFTAMLYMLAKRVESIPKDYYHRRLRPESIMTTSSFSNKNVERLSYRTQRIDQSSEMLTRIPRRKSSCRQNVDIDYPAYDDVQCMGFEVE
jgi:hypothetical protein